MPTLGEALAWKRKQRGLTQAEVCLATGVSRNTLQRMEKGDHNARLDDVLVVVAYLGMPLGEAVRHPRRDTPWSAPRT